MPHNHALAPGNRLRQPPVKGNFAIPHHRGS